MILPTHWGVGKDNQSKINIYKQKRNAYFQSERKEKILPER